MQVNREQILQFLTDENLSWTEKPERGEFQLNSPFQKDSKKRLGINYKKNGCWNDFKAGTYGNWWEFVSEVKGFTNHSQAKIFFLKHYLNLNPYAFLEKEKDQEDYEPILEFPKNTIPLQKFHYEAYQYLYDRGLTDSIINQFKIFWNEEIKRIYFPVYENNNLIFYSARTVDINQKIRWLNSGGASNGPLWGIERTSEIIYLFEGIFDAILHPAGVAMFGNRLRENQINKIINHSYYKIVLIGDSDFPGRLGTYNNAKVLSQRHSNVWVHLWEPKYKDYNENPSMSFNLIKVDSSFDMRFSLNENINFRQNKVETYKIK
jgi:DNA primase